MAEKKYTIALISASVREGRKSHRVALYLQNELQSMHNAKVEMLDLATLDFPIFHERLKFQKNPSAEAKAFAQTISDADGVIIVTPEYNSGYPASLKNAIDLLIDEWYRKPVAISTVSGGAFGGSQVIMPLQFALWKLKAWTVPAMFPVPQVQESFDEGGVPKDEAATKKRSDKFLEELFYSIEAARKMKE
jgi:NAD(P)H-dependent FMN reductase